MESTETFHTALENLNKTDRAAVLRTIDLLNGYRGDHVSQTATRTLVQSGVAWRVLNSLSLEGRG